MFIIYDIKRQQMLNKVECCMHINYKKIMSFYNSFKFSNEVVFLE